MIPFIIELVLVELSVNERRPVLRVIRKPKNSPALCKLCAFIKHILAINFAFQRFQQSISRVCHENHRSETGIVKCLSTHIRQARWIMKLLCQMLRHKKEKKQLDSNFRCLCTINKNIAIFTFFSFLLFLCFSIKAWFIFVVKTKFSVTRVSS